jgi:hypothetical protein
MVVPTSDGRTVRKMADWTDLTYVVVDVEGNGQQLIVPGGLPVAERVSGDVLTVLHTVLSDWAS